MLNWKIIVGALLVFGGFKEAINILNASVGLTASLYVPGLFGAVTLIFAGWFLIIKGRTKNSI